MPRNSDFPRYSDFLPADGKSHYIEVLLYYVQTISESYSFEWRSEQPYFSCERNKRATHFFKEFVACQNDDNFVVLVLSPFAGVRALLYKFRA